MVIDLVRENVMPLREAAKRLPRRRGGRKVATATLYRWAQSGVRGVRLETIQVGGTLCTSAEALQRFCEKLTRQRGVKPPDLEQRSDKADEKALEQTGW